jgi:hypothetical protein
LGIDDPEHVPVAVQLAARRAELDGPDPADAQIALGAHDPAGIVLSVEGLLSAGVGERGEHLLGRRCDHARKAQVVTHARSST